MSTENRELPDVRRRLLDEAARILAEQGPAALSARRLVKEVGASTMAVYTHFGSMPALVRALMREGFARFDARLAAVRTGAGDPVAELFALCRIYREFGLAEPHVYAVMFGGTALAGFELTAEDREMGLYVLRIPHAAVRRSMAEGRFREADAGLLVRQLWCQLHGLAQLERVGYFEGPFAAEECLEALLRAFAVGAGDSVEAAADSLRGR